MENISQYIEGCKSIGMKECNLFQTVDLYDAKDPLQVLNNINHLAHVASTTQQYKGPSFKNNSSGSTQAATKPNDVPATHSTSPKQYAYVLFSTINHFCYYLEVRQYPNQVQIKEANREILLVAILGVVRQLLEVKIVEEDKEDKEDREVAHEGILSAVGDKMAEDKINLWMAEEEVCLVSQE